MQETKHIVTNISVAVKISSLVADDTAYAGFNFDFILKTKVYLQTGGDHLRPTYQPSVKLWLFQNSFAKWMLVFHVQPVSIKICGNDLKLLKNGMLLTNSDLSKINISSLITSQTKVAQKILKIFRMG